MKFNQTAGIFHLEKSKKNGKMESLELSKILKKNEFSIGKIVCGIDSKYKIISINELSMAENEKNILRKSYKNGSSLIKKSDNSKEIVIKMAIHGKNSSDLRVLIDNLNSEISKDNLTIISKLDGVVRIYKAEVNNNQGIYDERQISLNYIELNLSFLILNSYSWSGETEITSRANKKDNIYRETIINGGNAPCDYSIWIHLRKGTCSDIIFENITTSESFNLNNPISKEAFIEINSEPLGIRINGTEIKNWEGFIEPTLKSGTNEFKIVFGNGLNLNYDIQVETKKSYR